MGVRRSDGILFTMNRSKREVEKSMEKIRLENGRNFFLFFFFFFFFDPTNASVKNKRSRVVQLEISITEIFENVAGYPASVQADTVHFHPPGTFVDEWREVVEKKTRRVKERERRRGSSKNTERQTERESLFLAARVALSLRTR